jgi:hypothetical protein
MQHTEALVNIGGTMVDISNRHDARDDDFAFDAPANGWLSDSPQSLLSIVWDIIFAVVFVLVTTAWVSQLATWIVQLTKWTLGLF